MITELYAHNFRTLLNTRLALKPRHLLIGKNNSGKTNLCWALIFPKIASVASLQDAIQMLPGAYADICNYGISHKEKAIRLGLKCEFEFNGISVSFAYELNMSIGSGEGALSRGPRCSLVSEDLRVSGGGFSDTQLLTSDGTQARLLHEGWYLDRKADPYVRTKAPSDSTMLSKVFELDTNATTIAFRNFLRKVSMFNLSAERIRDGWRERRETAGLFFAGDNLAQVIYQLKTQSEGRYRRILDRLRRVEPKLSAINFLTGPEQSIVPFVELEGGREASWASLSDGTLRLLALSYLIEWGNMLSHGKDAIPPVIVLEEPENAVYVGELAPFLYDLENVAPLTQFIMTTHSPYLIDQFDRQLDAVTLLRRVDWHTEAKSLSVEKERIEKELERAPLGDQYFRELLG